MAELSILQTAPTYDELHRQGYTDGQIARELERARVEQGLHPAAKPLTVWKVAVAVFLGNVLTGLLGLFVYIVTQSGR